MNKLTDFNVLKKRVEGVIQAAKKVPYGPGFDENTWQLLCRIGELEGELHYIEKKGTENG